MDNLFKVKEVENGGREGLWVIGFLIYWVLLGLKVDSFG